MSPKRARCSTESPPVETGGLGKRIARRSVDLVPLRSGQRDSRGKRDLLHTLGARCSNHRLDLGGVAQNPSNGHGCGSDAKLAGHRFQNLVELGELGVA